MVDDRRGLHRNRITVRDFMPGGTDWPIFGTSLLGAFLGRPKVIAYGIPLRKVHRPPCYLFPASLLIGQGKYEESGLCIVDACLTIKISLHDEEVDMLRSFMEKAQHDLSCKGWD